MTMIIRVTNLSNWAHEDVLVGSDDKRVRPGESVDVTLMTKDEATIVNVRPTPAVGGKLPAPVYLQPHGGQMEPDTVTFWKPMRNV